MAALDPTLRRQLEKSVLEARTLAESGAQAALQQLTVDQSEPFAHMSPDERDLRVKLRARGRQIGDTRTRTGQQTIDHLTVECAYEHWQIARCAPEKKNYLSRAREKKGPLRLLI